MNAMECVGLMTSMHGSKCILPWRPILLPVPLIPVKFSYRLEEAEYIWILFIFYEFWIPFNNIVIRCVQSVLCIIIMNGAIRFFVQKMNMFCCKNKNVQNRNRIRLHRQVVRGAHSTKKMGVHQQLSHQNKVRRKRFVLAIVCACTRRCIYASMYTSPYARTQAYIYWL